MDTYLTRRYSPLRDAVQSITAFIRPDPYTALSTYRDSWVHYDAASHGEFSRHIRTIADIAHGVEADATVTIVSHDTAALYGGLLGAMISRSAYPNVVATTSFDQAYRDFIIHISDDGSLSLRKQSRSVHAFAECYSLTLAPDIRATLRDTARHVAPDHETTTYTMTVITLYLYMQMMNVAPPLSDILSILPEDDFDTMLELIAQGHGGFFAH